MPRYYDTLAPDAISDELAPMIDELGLRENCRELAEEGWTVIQNVADASFNDQLRAELLELAQRSPFSVGGQGGGGMLLTQGDTFARAVLNPKLMAMAEFSVGRGFLISQVASSVRTKGSPCIGLHAEHNWLPAPFPEHNMLFSAIWACDEFTKAGGSTMIIPGSHKHRRHPNLQEAMWNKGAIAIECPPNSAVLWDGNLWHSNWPKKTDGERVVFHILYGRLSMRPIEDYSPYADELIAAHGEPMSQLLGREDFLCGSGGADTALVQRTFNNAKR